MRGLPSILLGAVGLALLDAVVSTQQGSTNVGGLFAGIGRLVRDFLSPQVPAFAAAASATSSSSAPMPSATLVAAAAPQPAPPALTPGGVTQPPVGPVLIPNAPGPGPVVLA